MQSRDTTNSLISYEVSRNPLFLWQIPAITEILIRVWPNGAGLWRATRSWTGLSASIVRKLETNRSGRSLVWNWRGSLEATPLEAGVAVLACPCWLRFTGNLTPSRANVRVGDISFTWIVSGLQTDRTGSHPEVESSYFEGDLNSMVGGARGRSYVAGDPGRESLPASTTR